MPKQNLRADERLQFFASMILRQKRMAFNDIFSNESNKIIYNVGYTIAYPLEGRTQLPFFLDRKCFCNLLATDQI